MLDTVKSLYICHMYCCRISEGMEFLCVLPVESVYGEGSGGYEYEYIYRNSELIFGT